MINRIFLSVPAILSLLISSAQVNLQTGSAEFSLPLFEWKDHKSRLNSNTFVRYTSGSGLKVNDIGSNLGQGWSLVTGGFITRIQIGEPDDQRAYGSVTDSDLTKYPAGYLYSDSAALKGCPSALTKYPIYRSENYLYAQHNKVAEDRQLDQFFFQFNGKSGVFILNPDTSNGKVAYLLGDSRVKITFETADLKSLGIRTTITAFTIQDVDGFIYRFANRGLTQLLRNQYCDGTLQNKIKQPTFSNLNVYHQTGFEEPLIHHPWVTTSWYLTQVKDPLTNRTINYNYTTENVAAFAGDDISYNSGGKEYITVVHKKTITQTPVLSGIDFPDGHQTVLTYGSFRADLPGSKVLSSIDFKYNGRFISRYLFNTTYVIRNRYGSPVSDGTGSARLFLKSVQKLGVDLKESTPPYVFDYYLGSSAPDDFVPPPFFYAKDIWGFYNGNNSKQYNSSSPVSLTSKTTKLNYYELKGLCLIDGTNNLIINPKPGFAKNGLLRQIIYPTGGTLSYEYAQNYGTLGGTQRAVAGVHVSRTLSTDGGYSNGCDNPITTNYNYTLPNGSSSLWGIEMPVHEFTSGTHYQPEEKYYHWTLRSAPFGECAYRYSYPGIYFQDQANSPDDYQKILQAASPILGALSVVGAIRDIMSVVTWSGGPVTALVSLIIDLFLSGYTCFTDMSKDETSTVYYNYDISGGALPNQFKRVEVVDGNGGNGKTIHEFTSDDDYPVWSLTNELLTQKQRFAPWAYGLPKLTTILDSAGTKVRVTRNLYDTSQARTTIGAYCFKGPACPPVNLNLISCNCVPKSNNSQKNSDWNLPASYNSNYLTSTTGQVGVDFYRYYSGRIELEETLDSSFSTNNPGFVVIRKSYTYHPLNFEVSSVTEYQSDGSQIIKSFDYNLGLFGGAYDILNQNNILTLPISTSTSIKRPGGGIDYLNIQRTDYKAVANQDIRPYLVQESRFDIPHPIATTVTPTVVQTLSYDASSNLVAARSEGARSIYNIYGYDDKFVTATIVNADSADKCAYTSFEQGESGNWTLPGAQSFSSSSITGSRSFNLSSGTIQCSGLNSSKPYRVSFWATSAPTINGATLVTSSPTISGFTFFEYDVAVNASSVSISGNGTIDELRLYPKGARMRTVTYDPLIGKTSEADENNRVTYYEYDALGRLQLVKDENRNVVKMYEYNNTSKTTGCPSVFYNNAITEYFIKACSGNTVGSTISFTIAANTYSSSISQEDADYQAQYYLLTNGQNYANTVGVCQTVYSNALIAKTFTTTSCDEGYRGGTVTYTVAAGTYTTTISQAVADSLALVDVKGNGQWYANSPDFRICVYDTVPHWVRIEPLDSMCMVIDGVGYMMYKAMDVNPNSSSYQQQMYKPTAYATCGPYYNDEISQVFTRNNCGIGAQPSSVIYTVTAGTYTSAISKADANAKAQNNIDTNGQAYANANGVCTWCSDAINEDFFKQDCTYPYYPLRWPVQKEACFRTSEVSKDDANALARAYGQAEANANGTCTQVDVVFAVYNNTGLAGWKIKLTNKVTGAVSEYPIPQGGSTIGPLTASIYDIQVSNTLYSSNSIFETVCSYYNSGFGATISNVDLSNPPCNTLMTISNAITTYYSADKSGNYYSQTCPSGTTASPYYVSIPAGSFASNSSQADADQQAIDFGQSQANQYGNCQSNQIYLYVWNMTQLYSYVLVLTDVYSNAQYTFPINWGGVMLPGPIPSSRYNVRIYNTANNTPGAMYWVGNYFGQGNDAYFYNVDINTNLFQITIQ